MFGGIAVASCLALLILFSILMRKLFKMKMGVAIFVNIILVPVLFAGLVMGIGQPFGVTVAENGGATSYFVFGSEAEYEFANGEKATISKNKDFGETIINNSPDTIVIERKMYGDALPDAVPVLLFVEPNSYEFFEDLSLDYVFESAPSTIETSSYASVVSRYELRVGQSDDAASFYYYKGETFDGKPDGTGTLIDTETGEEWTGEWENGKFQEDETEAEYDS